MFTATPLKIPANRAHLIPQGIPIISTKQLMMHKGQINSMTKNNLPSQVVTLVKTSTGMTVATLPKGAKGAVLKTTGTNSNPLVKVMPQNSNKIITTVKSLPSNMIQVNKPSGQFVFSNATSGQIPMNQQVIMVSSTASLKNIQTLTNTQALSFAQTKTSTIVQPINKGTLSTLQNVKIAGKPILMPLASGVVGPSKTVTLSKNTVSFHNFHYSWL